MKLGDLSTERLRDKLNKLRQERIILKNSISYIAERDEKDFNMPRHSKQQELEHRKKLLKECEDKITEIEIELFNRC